MTRLSFFAATFACVLQVSAQDQQLQSWFMMNASGPIHGDISFHGDVQLRAFDNLSPNILILRPGISYKFHENHYLTLGYMWQPFWRNKDLVNFVDEHRVWVQWMADFLMMDGKLNLNTRLRFEYRIRPGSSEEDELDVGFRNRLQIKVGYQLNSDWLLTVGDELFVNANSAWGNGGQFAGFDQNRAFITLGYQLIAKTLRIELGYMNQFLRRPVHPKFDLMSHNVLVNSVIAF